MSGIEVLGIALAVLPLLVSTVEHYDDILRPFKRYKNFDPELNRFKNELASEQIIFRTESLLLLTSVTTYDVATEMLEGGNHPLWHDSKLEADLSQCLGASREACKTIIGIIDDDLKNIREECRFFDTASARDKIAWRLRVGRKLKWSLSQSQLQKRLKDLRRHIKVFQRHSSQIPRIAEKHNNTEPNSQIPKERSYDECCVIQQAAAKLYQALINSCMAHQEHTLHFSLETHHCSDQGQGFVRFHFAFAQSVMTSNHSPIWVAIESEFGKAASVLGKEGKEKVENSLQTLKTRLKRYRDPDDQGLQNKMPKKFMKSVRFADLEPSDAASSNTTPKYETNLVKAMFSSSWNSSPSSQAQNPSNSGLAASNRACSIADTSNSTSLTPTVTIDNSSNFQLKSIDGTLPDFCKQRDLCSYITRWSKYTCNPTDTFIGYLGREWPCSHRVLVTPQVINRLRTPTSLTQFLSRSVGQSHSSRLLYIDSVDLAKQLASAILLFHSTPFLSKTWKSEDIVFYNSTIAPKRGHPKLNDPHLTVRVTSIAESSTKIQSPATTSAQQQQSLVYDPRIRNPYIYSLGVVLLELGCQAPLSKLREEEDLINGSSTSSDFEAANAISETLSTDMGIPFQKMVQKCLNCDFGNGTNLNDPRLQAAFQRDVVCELEDLENRLRKLQVGK